MKTYTVPIYLGVKAKSKEQAFRITQCFMEYALEVENDNKGFPYCDVGSVDEIIKEKKS